MTDMDMWLLTEQTEKMIYSLRSCLFAGPPYSGVFSRYWERACQSHRSKTGKADIQWAA